jgi:hypothetical protein
MQEIFDYIIVQKVALFWYIYVHCYICLYTGDAREVRDNVLLSRSGTAAGRVVGKGKTNGVQGPLHTRHETRESFECSRDATGGLHFSPPLHGMVL